jgi:hypothetical protein
MALSRLAAIKKLAWMVQADQFPELDSNALGELIDEHKRYSSWEAISSYAVGDQIVPTVPNGRVYNCLVAGSSGTLEPSFPQISYSVGQCFYDGVGPNNGSFPLTWQDSGFTQQEIYDVRAAAREGWMRKASICANLVNTDDGKMNIQIHILQENCIQMAAKFRSFGIL